MRHNGDGGDADGREIDGREVPERDADGPDTDGPDTDAERKTSPGDDVDWALAGRLAGRLAPEGPQMTGYTREQVHRALADASSRAEPHVREVTRLADGLEVPVARVVDRAGWSDAATRSMALMMNAEPAERRGRLDVTGKAGAAQAGAVFAFLSTAILGQYDPFADGGTLLLVAPNVVAVERALKVRPEDFRMWVCLHEVTHRVQFSSSPWLADYMRESVDLLGEDADEPVSEMIGRLAAQLNRRRSGGDGERAAADKGIVGLVTAAAAPPQREAIERMLMLGTLLEGHADHVMDAVGPQVVPTVGRIRKAFDHRRRHNPSVLQRIMRALLGVDAKMAQYVRGKAFVDEVVDVVGMDRFNTVWTSPETLPRPDEIEEPRRWIARVLG